MEIKREEKWKLIRDGTVIGTAETYDEIIELRRKEDEKHMDGGDRPAEGSQRGAAGGV